MNNKVLGIILITFCIILTITTYVNDTRMAKGRSCACEGGMCPHDIDRTTTYIGFILIAGLASLATYLLIFEKSQLQIINAITEQKQIKINEEKFSILLKGLDEFEKKVILAVKDQDGITQQTLRLRTDMHKSKLSLVLDSLEKKDLITKTPKGKTNQIYLKIKV